MTQSVQTLKRVRQRQLALLLWLISSSCSLSYPSAPQRGSLSVGAVFSWGKGPGAGFLR